MLNFSDDAVTTLQNEWRKVGRHLMSFEKKMLKNFNWYNIFSLPKFVSTFWIGACLKEKIMNLWLGSTKSAIARQVQYYFSTGRNSACLPLFVLQKFFSWCKDVIGFLLVRLRPQIFANLWFKRKNLIGNLWYIYIFI